MDSTSKKQSINGDNDLSHHDMSSNSTNNNNSSEEFNLLVDKVYSKILDLAKDKNMLQINQPIQTTSISLNSSFNNGNNANTSMNNLNHSQLHNQSQITTTQQFINLTDQFAFDNEISMEEENRRAYPPQNILTSNTILYGILKHTCLNCSKTFEQSKSLRKHFIMEHIIYKPTYKCKLCMENMSGCDDDELEIFELDDYLKHLLQTHNNLNDLQNLYDLFILKYVQDVFCDYFVEGRFYLDPQQIKHINKLKFGKENCTLIQKMHSKIYENYFINDDNQDDSCKPAITLTSKSIKSNLLYSQITKAEVFREICDYLKADSSKMTEDALSAYLSVQVSAQQPQPSLVDNYKYTQCKFCMKIFRECNAYKEHVMEVHTFNEYCNRCLVCPYCKQLLKSNFDKNVDATVLLNIHMKKCLALKSDYANVFNLFKFNSITTPTISKFSLSDSSNRKRDNDEHNDSVLNSNTNSHTLVPSKRHKYDNSSVEVCYLCEFKLNDTTLDRHLYDVHTICKCSVCEQEILKSEFVDHLNQIHMPECTETCYSCPFEKKLNDECGTHLSLNEFMNHECILNKLDEYKKTQACPICLTKVVVDGEAAEQSSDNFESLSKHFTDYHAKIMFNCELCTASFRSSWCLVEHIKCEHKPIKLDGSESIGGDNLCENGDNGVEDESFNLDRKHYFKCFKCTKVITCTSETSLKAHIISGECVSNKNDDKKAGNEKNTSNELMDIASNLVESEGGDIINPLSILSNVSTSVPHILSVTSLSTEPAQINSSTSLTLTTINSTTSLVTDDNTDNKQSSNDDNKLKEEPIDREHINENKHLETESIETTIVPTTSDDIPTANVVEIEVSSSTATTEQS